MMDRRSRLVLLGVLGLGVFLSGLELMVTAVALPSIVVGLASWTQLRLASWIINGYLLAYVITMPLAGRLADQWGARRLFLGGLAVFIIGSILAGRAQSLEELIAGRVVQAIGGGVLVPVGTAAASHLFDDHDRPRALGVIGGADVPGHGGRTVRRCLRSSAGFHPATSLEGLGIDAGPLHDALAAPWRYVFYVNVPIGIAALALAWAASGAGRAERQAGPVDLAGRGRVLVRPRGSSCWRRPSPAATKSPGTATRRSCSWLPAPSGLACIALAARLGLRHPRAFLDARLFRHPAFASAALISLLTGYGFATAIVGGAVFVDRVLYGGPDVQRVALGAARRRNGRRRARARASCSAAWACAS